MDLLYRDGYINGAWVQGLARFPVYNPANGALVAQVADLGVEHTQQAIAAASQALPAWAHKTAKERAVILRRWHDLILAHADALATLMTAEQGKPLGEARGEVAYGASFIEWFAEEAKRAYGKVIPTTVASRRYLTMKQPVGVIAAITPWNFPIAMITRKVAPALAAGCPVIIKPAEDTPLSALALAALAHEAGIPAGVLNIIPGLDAPGIGKLLCASAQVRKLSFTGSTEVGKILYRQCADTVKKLSLELGGNAPFIVFDDADLDAAVVGALASKYRNAGQTCVCANRILVQESVYDAFANKLADAVAKLEVGPGTQANVSVGPLINQEALEKVDGLVRAALSQGAQALVGGARHGTSGLFYQPTVLTQVTPEMDVVTQEIFGPVAPLVPFKTEAEGIALANATPFGLASYFYARDMARIWRVSEQLEYGMVAVNDGLLSTEVAPFGGVKESGLGREGAAEGLDEYLELKYLCLGGITA
jgi:succinate-semialdehyde dehydrogenase / glutarate-semialdehyde dehydrogenase